MRRVLAMLCVGVLSLSLAPAAFASVPTNDEQAAAIVVTLTPDVPFAITQDTTEATVNATDPVRTQTSEEWPFEWSVPIGPTVWYVYTAAESGTILFDLTGTDYVPMMLALLDGTVIDFSSEAIPCEVLAGETYYFVIGDEDASDGSGGLLTVSVSWVPPTPPDPVPVAAQVGFTGATLVDGRLVVNGTLTATGDYTSSSVEVQAAQRGKAPATGLNFVTDPGTDWTVSVPPSADSPSWGAVRTTLTIRAFYYLDGSENAIGSATYVATVRVEQAAPEPPLELGSVSGRFTLTDDDTGEAIGIVVDVLATRTGDIDLTRGQLAIKSGRFAGTYQPSGLDVAMWDGNPNPNAVIYVLLPNGNTLCMSLMTQADGGQSAFIAMSDAGWTQLDSMRGSVTKKGFTITMPAL